LITGATYGRGGPASTSVRDKTKGRVAGKLQKRTVAFEYPPMHPRFLTLKKGGGGVASRERKDKGRGNATEGGKGKRERKNSVLNCPGTTIWLVDTLDLEGKV